MTNIISNFMFRILPSGYRPEAGGVLNPRDELIIVGTVIYRLLRGKKIPVSGERSEKEERMTSVASKKRMREVDCGIALLSMC